MNIAMFFIFLVCNLIIVPLCQYSYGNLWEYREGMVLDALSQSPVSNIPGCGSSVKSTGKAGPYSTGSIWRPAFSYALSAFWITWPFSSCGWSGCWSMCAVLSHLIIIPHRRMYRLKLENGWMGREEQEIVRVDTAVSAASSRLALDWKWHLPILVLTAATVYFVDAAERKFQVAAPEAWPFWLLYGTGVGACLLFLAMHVGVERRPNRVYSEDSQINLAANQPDEAVLAEGLVYASWVNGVSWIFMAIAYYRYGPDLPGAVYAIYTGLIFLAAAALLLPLGLSVGKRREVLEADTSACYIDDDEYWKKGWYNQSGRPASPRPGQVQQHEHVHELRAAGGQGDHGSPGGRHPGRNGLDCGAPVRFCQRGGGIHTGRRHLYLEAAGYDCSFGRDEIQSVELLDSMPEEHFTRTNGGSTEEYRWDTSGERRQGDA